MLGDTKQMMNDEYKQLEEMWREYQLPTESEADAISISKSTGATIAAVASKTHRNHADNESTTKILQEETKASSQSSLPKHTREAANSIPAKVSTSHPLPILYGENDYGHHHRRHRVITNLNSLSSSPPVTTNWEPYRDFPVGPHGPPFVHPMHHGLPHPYHPYHYQQHYHGHLNPYFGMNIMPPEVFRERPQDGSFPHHSYPYHGTTMLGNYHQHPPSRKPTLNTRSIVDNRIHSMVPTVAAARDGPKESNKTKKHGGKPTTASSKKANGAREANGVDNATNSRRRGDPDERWMEMYGRLKKYKESHNGSTRVPRIYKPDPQLSRWVGTQRRLCKRQDRVELLNSIDFVWKIYESKRGGIQDKQWMEMYGRLKKYKESHNGSTRVPIIYMPDPQLGRWVKSQRDFCKREDRVELLNAIDFEWKIRKNRESWAKLYTRLLQYKQKHGSTRVPARYPKDPQLGSWVHRQRRECKKQERRVLLDKIGFEWRLRSTKKKDP